MPYPNKDPINKHDIVSPSTISISSGKLQPLFDSKESILHQLQHIKVEMIKQAFAPVYTYDDAPTVPKPLSRALFIGGFCNLSDVVPSSSTIFHYDSFIPFSDMKLCHIAVKRTDTSSSGSLHQTLLDNSNKFKNFCENLRTHSKLALIICPKTDRFGFLIPMNEYEDGSDYAAYYYVGERKTVIKMISSYTNGFHSSHDNDTVADEADELIYKPDDDDDFQHHDANDNYTSNNDDDNNFWKPPTEKNDNGDDLMWHPISSSNNDENTSFTHTSLMDNVAVTEEHHNNDINYNQGANERFHADEGAAAADKFYSELTRSLETRSESILYHMRNFNGWVKATQIAELDPRTILSASDANHKKRKRTKHPLRVLDLACGKGGDLGKWILHNRGIQSYVGSDVARGSLVDAAIRARNMNKQLRNKCTFICADLGADVPGRLKNKRKSKMQKLLSWSLESDNGVGDPIFRPIRGGGIQAIDKFDVVSIQFAIHYMMSSIKRARRFFQTVSELLDIGGNLIATTIDARVVVAHLMDTGYNFHFDNNTEGSGGGDDDEYVTVKVGKDACQLKFHRDIVKRLLQNSQLKSSSIYNSDHKNDSINSNLFGLEYTFTLIEGHDHAAGVGQAVDLPEWLTPLPVLKQLAEEAGMVMEYASNFHEFYEERKDPLINHSVHNALYNMNVLNWNGSISEQEWEISRMYVAIKFRKEKESTLELDDDDDDDDDNQNSDEEVEHDEQQQHQQVQHIATVTQGTNDNIISPSKSPIEINMSDPNVIKLYTKAMAKTKISYKGDWQSLSSDERKALIHVELSKMISNE